MPNKIIMFFAAHVFVLKFHGILNEKYEYQVNLVKDFKFILYIKSEHFIELGGKNSYVMLKKFYMLRIIKYVFYRTFPANLQRRNSK